MGDNTGLFNYGSEELDLRQLFDILLNRLWLIIILPIVFSIAAALINLYVLLPVYETSTTLYINEKKQGAPLAYNDLSLSSQLVKDYRVLIKSRMFTEEVIKRLGIINLTPNQLADRITVNAVNDTRLIEIKARSTDPQLACDIANKLAEVFEEKIRDIIQIENITIVDKAIVPSTPISPNVKLNILIAFCLGLLLAVGLAFLIDYFDDKIRTAEDVEKLGIPLLGTVPEYNMKWEDPNQ